MLIQPAISSFVARKDEAANQSNFPIATGLGECHDGSSIRTRLPDTNAPDPWCRVFSARRCGAVWASSHKMGHCVEHSPGARALPRPWSTPGAPIPCSADAHGHVPMHRSRDGSLAAEYLTIA